MFSKAKFETHKRQVLGRRGRGLRGNELVAFFRRTLDTAPTATRQGLRRANAFILWHLTFCPEEDDRSRVMDTATDFSRRVLQTTPVWTANPRRAVPYAIPFSPVGTYCPPEEARDFFTSFLDPTIDWRLTLRLLRENHCLPTTLTHVKSLANTSRTFTSGFGREIMQAMHTGMIEGFVRSDCDPSLYLVCDGKVPDYPALRTDSSEIEKADYAFRYLRMALTARQRTVNLYSMLFAVDERSADDTCFAVGTSPATDLLTFPAEAFDYQLVTNPQAPDEQLCLFSETINVSKALLCLFIKRGWPVGYAVANISLPPTARITYHIFHECRGTPTSATMLQQFLAISRDRLSPQIFTMQLPARGLRKGIPAENDAHTIAFYQRQGFTYDPTTGLFLKLA